MNKFRNCNLSFLRVDFFHIKLGHLIVDIPLVIRYLTQVSHRLHIDSSHLARTVGNDKQIYSDPLDDGRMMALKTTTADSWMDRANRSICNNNGNGWWTTLYPRATTERGFKFQVRQEATFANLSFPIDAATAEAPQRLRTTTATLAWVGKFYSREENLCAENSDYTATIQSYIALVQTDMQGLGVRVCRHAGTVESHESVASLPFRQICSNVVLDSRLLCHRTVWWRWEFFGWVLYVCSYVIEWMNETCK